MGVIPASFAALQTNYPRRDVKNPDLYQYVEKVMSGLPGTPCCVQMSHALNMAGILVPKSSYRRDNAALKINGIIYYYLLATDELEDFLFNRCNDDGELLTLQAGQPPSMAKIKRYIANRPGLILFRFSKFRMPPVKDEFEHTELWNGTNILQRDMAEDFLFRRPRVLLWDTNDTARWLVDYMATQP